MASAVVATAFGGPEVLAIVEVEVPEPRPGEVLIDVLAVGTNPVDYKSYSGGRAQDPGQFPMRIGREAAGSVRSVGEGAIGPSGPLRPGDAVIAFPAKGAYATELLVDASSVVPKPAMMPFEQASGLMLAGATATHAVVAAGVRPGDTVLVHGAAGGVGLMVAQLTVNAGARVIGTASESSKALVEEFGAEPVPYGPGLVDRIAAAAPEGVDAAIDTVGTDEAIDASIALVVDRRRIVTIAAFRRGFELGLKVLGGAPGADPGTDIRMAARLDLVRQVEAGKVRVLVSATHPLSEAASAHRELANGHTHGKIVLIP
jgi:NADPH:quinone reductase-like Zn-dependent oxidoreductase